MATFIHRKTGHTPGYEIRFYDPHGDRIAVYLGGRKYSKKTATELKEIVEHLVFYRDNAVTIPDKKTLAWLEAASPEIREKLGKVGLIEVPKTHTLGELWDSFLAQRTDLKKATIEIDNTTKTWFFKFFDANESLKNLTEEQMLEWKKSLSKQLAKASVATYLKQAKACFNWAVKKEWITKSPLNGIGIGSFVNKSKDRVISMEEYRRLLDACPCQDWRVIIALARIGGLRCPSEVFALRWADMNWEKGRFFVRSPKTEHHAGKEDRIVPIFPELKTELETLFSMPQSKGKEFVINRYRDKNLGTLFSRIAKQAGLPEIPRPFDNMRATRSNEIYARFGPAKESEWIGHSAQTRADHYDMITDDDYESAANWEIAYDKNFSPAFSP